MRFLGRLFSNKGEIESLKGDIESYQRTIKKFQQDIKTGCYNNKEIRARIAIYREKIQKKREQIARLKGK